VAICHALESIREYKRARSGKIRPNSASTPVHAMEDELARDALRQEANLTLAQDNLTTTQDSVVPETVGVASTEDTFHWSQPSFDQVVSRWYRIATPTWAYTHSQDTNILGLDISKSLFNIQTLFDRVKRYRYWRGGVKLRLQVNSTPFHYGSLVAAIIPYYTVTESASPAFAQETTTYALSGQKCFGILSANTGKPLELSCSFQVPNEYLDITQATDVQPFFLYVTVMNPLKVAGGATTPSLQLSIFAQFTDFEILAPSEITANSSSKKVVAADKEQSNKMKQGTLGKVAGTVSDIASKLTSVPVVGSIASAVAPIASAVGGIFDFFGWDKPTNVSSQVFTIERAARGLQHGSGLDPSECVGLKPEQKLSTETKHFGADDPATRGLLALIQTPMWAGSFTIPNNQVVDNVFKKMYIRPFAPDVNYTIPTETQRHDYLSYYSQFFKASRGGYKYIIHFDTSAYTTARIRLTFEPSTNNVAAITDGGDSFSRIVDVQGATTIAVEVPYCYPSARMPISYSITNTGVANGQLLFSLVNPVQTNGSSPDVIYVNIFRCAADDFRFYQPHIFVPTKTYLVAAASQTATPNTRIQANSISELAQGPTPCLGDGPKVMFDRVTEDEEVLSHNDFLHRYHVAQNTDASNQTVLYPTSGDAFYYLTPFRAYRGSVRRSLIDANCQVIGLAFSSVGSNNTEAISAGGYMHQISGGASTQVPIEIPYNNNVRFLPLRFPETLYLDAYVRLYDSNNATPTPTVWSAGDDFTLGLRSAPLPIKITIP